MPPLLVIIIELYIQQTDIYWFSCSVPATGPEMPDKVIGGKRDPDVTVVVFVSYQFTRYQLPGTNQRHTEYCRAS